MRDPRSYVTTDTIPDDDRKVTALARERAWLATLAASEAPGNWRVWVQWMSDIERDRYGGTTGYADPEFYGQIYRFSSGTRLLLRFVPSSISGTE